MADSPSDADRIREKRLAKLGQQAQQNAAAAAAASSAPKSPPALGTPQDDPKPKISISRNEPNLENPFEQLQAQKAGNGRPAINIQPTSSRPAKSQPQPAARSISQQGGKDSIEDWEHRVLCGLFRVSLHAERLKDVHGNVLHFLPGVRADLDESSKPSRLTNQHLDEAMFEVIPQLHQTKPLDYLLACWKRTSRQLRGMRMDVKDDPKILVIREARRILMSHCIFAITAPEMYNSDDAPIANLVPHLLAESESDKGVDLEFLSEAVSRFEEDDTIKEALVEAMVLVSKALSTKTMNDDYRPCIQALQRFSRFKPLVEALALSPYFSPPSTPAERIETSTLLGPFFRISPLQPEVALSYFSAPKTRDRGFILNSQNALRMTLQTHQEELFDIINNFIKSGAAPRNHTLDWLALTVNANHRRRAMRPDPRVISSDAFMVNITAILDRLCEPFMDAKFTKIGRIEAEYFRRSPRVDVSDETKINADQATAEKFYAQKAEGESTFISEIFFLTVASHHYGTEAANAKLTTLKREMKRLDEHIERVEGDRERYVHNPMLFSRFEESLRRLKSESEKGHCLYLSIEGVLLDELSQARSMAFMRYVIVWIVKLVTGADFPNKSFNLPLSSTQPDVFTSLPEYFIEDIVDHFKFVTSHMPHIVTPTQCDELVMICITFLRSSDYIKNPGVKSGLVSILFYGVMPVPRNKHGILGDVLNSLPFALDHLLHALMQAYIECENTGAHNQFYDKFNIRYEIFQVIKHIWSNELYHDRLETESKVNGEFFIQFVNMVLNDATYVLDESFSSFHKINQLTRELRELQSDPSASEEARREKQDALEDSKGKAKSYMQLTTESIDTLKMFTKELADSFTAPEVVQRLADMLDYNLEALVGPKSSNLRVENPEQYKFRPAVLLSELMDVYLNLSSKKTFHVAVARDGRSYKPANFTTAADIQRRRVNPPKPDSELQQWMRLAERVAEAKAEDDAEEEDMGEVPDDFLDPLMATVMLDPVILPVSRITMDRSTIRQHLLSDPHDPYSRAPLKIEDVIPDDALKAKIEAFRAEKKGARQAAPAAAAGSEPMDTS